MYQKLFTHNKNTWYVKEEGNKYYLYFSENNGPKECAFPDDYEGFESIENAENWLRKWIKENGCY